MRKLVAILLLGAAAVPLLGGGAASGAPTTCSTQPTYAPNQGATTAAAAANSASAGLSHIAADGTVSLSFTSAVCGGFRIVLRAKEIRPGNLGYPHHDGYTTLANILTIIPTGPTTVTFKLTQRGLDLLTYARSIGQSLTVFVITHVRPSGTTVSSEAIQIITVS